MSWRLAHAEVARDVLDHDDRLVDQDADRQGQAAERHRVERAAGEVERRQRAKDRHRDRGQHDQAAAHTAQEQQHDQDDQDAADQRRPGDAADRVADQHRLVHDDVHAEVVRLWIEFADALQDALRTRLDFIDDRERIGAGLAVDRDVDLAAAVDANDVGLDLIGVLHLGDIAEEHRTVLVDAQRRVVELGDLLHHRVAQDQVVGLADLGVAGWYEYVLVAQAAHDIHRRHVARMQLVAVDATRRHTQPAR